MTGRWRRVEDISVGSPGRRVDPTTTHRPLRGPRPRQGDTPTPVNPPTNFADRPLRPTTHRTIPRDLLIFSAKENDAKQLARKKINEICCVGMRMSVDAVRRFPSVSSWKGRRCGTTVDVKCESRRRVGTTEGTWEFVSECSRQYLCGCS